ncbi:MAG: hypothetical protein ABSG21_04195 [Spirochaetia bacterium]|jgi:hypothetical protein
MPEQVHVYDELATRDGFNRSLRHFKFISRVVGDFESKRNIADTLSECLADKSIEPRQVLPTLNAILVDKYHYSCRSHNLAESFDAFDGLAATVGTWRAVDMVVAYFHPELGVVVVNPKNRAHWEGVRSLKRNELVTVFAGAFAGTNRDKKYDTAISLLITLMEGGKAKTPLALTKGTFVFRKPAPVAAAPVPARRGRKPGPRAAKASLLAAAEAASPTASALPAYSSASPSAPPAAAAPLAPAALAAPSGAPKRMTPMYSIPVTNELFHNGNVEAWKKIIQSYTTKYPGLEVYVFYEGERIHDINTLFKWGKVKHGSAIMIAVAGDDIRDVAKLQRYLKQGASHMFEAFLKAQVGAILNLF